MNKITKLLFAFVAVASFSLTSCEPDYVTDGSTAPSEAYVKVSYLDDEGNVTSTEEYFYDKTNSQVSGIRSPMQDAEGNSYTESQIIAAAAPNPQNPDLAQLGIFFEFQEDSNSYEINSTGRNRATINIGGSNNIYTSTDGGYLEVLNYNVFTDTAAPDMYFRSQSEFSFYAVNTNGEKCKVEGTATTNFKL